MSPVPPSQNGNDHTPTDPSTPATPSTPPTSPYSISVTDSQGHSITIHLTRESAYAVVTALLGQITVTDGTPLLLASFPCGCVGQVGVAEQLLCPMHGGGQGGDQTGSLGGMPMH